MGCCIERLPLLELSKIYPMVPLLSLSHFALVQVVDARCGSFFGTA